MDHGAIVIVFDDGDAMLYESAADAATDGEAEEVRNGSVSYFTGDGRRLAATLVDEMLPRGRIAQWLGLPEVTVERIHLEPTDEFHQDLVRSRLLEFMLEGYRHRLSEDAMSNLRTLSLSALVEKAMELQEGA